MCQIGTNGELEAKRGISVNVENISIDAALPAGISGDRRTRPRPGGRLGEGVLVVSYMFVELVAVFALGLAIAYFYVGQTLSVPDYYQSYITPLLLAPVLLGIRFHSEGLYEVGNLQRAVKSTGSVLKCIAMVFIGLVVLGFLAGIASSYSRIWFVGWSVGSAVLVLLLRAILDRILTQLKSHRIPLSRIAIYGDISSVLKVRAALSEKEAGIEIVGSFSDAKVSDEALNIRGDLGDLLALARNINIDRVVIAKEVASRLEISRIMNALSNLPAEVLLYPNFLGDTVNLSGLTSVNHSRLIRIQKRPISDWGLLIKAAMDKIISAIAVIALAPLLVVVAICIKLDSKGPVFFKQRRHGYNLGVIDVWKFRTMTVQENDGKFKQAVKDDKRITRIGNFLRKTSIDELPQLFNVLKGEMSIVGPRPHPVKLNSDYAARLMRYDNRHKVKPGITGWAQINGYRGPTMEPDQMHKRIEYDLEYIENWSLWFDSKIILATPFLGIVHKNAF